MYQKPKPEDGQLTAEYAGGTRCEIVDGASGGDGDALAGRPDTGLRVGAERTLAVALGILQRAAGAACGAAAGWIAIDGRADKGRDTGARVCAAARHGLAESRRARA